MAISSHHKVRMKNKDLILHCNFIIIIIIIIIELYTHFFKSSIPETRKSNTTRQSEIGRHDWRRRVRS